MALANTIDSIGVPLKINLGGVPRVLDVFIRTGSGLFVICGEIINWGDMVPVFFENETNAYVLSANNMIKRLFLLIVERNAYHEKQGIDTI